MVAVSPVVVPTHRHDDIPDTLFLTAMPAENPHHSLPARCRIELTKISKTDDYTEFSIIVDVRYLGERYD